MNIANRNIQVRAIASTRINWKVKSNGFKEIYESNQRKSKNESDNLPNELGPIDHNKGYPKHLLSGYKKVQKDRMKKYKHLPQENIMEENIEEENFSDLDRSHEGSPYVKPSTNKKIKDFYSKDFEVMYSK